MISSSVSTNLRRYMLAGLMASYALNIVDRQIIAILVEPIKADLGLSDTNIGFLTGFAFALFYATAGLPIALLADRYSRKNLIAVALLVWSGMTAVSGLAQNFVQLAIARIGVGIGEAGGSPPAHSMISDLYEPNKRSTALAIFGLGIPIGTLIGLGFGGWVGQEFGWRNAFFIAGAPGLLLAAIIALTFREPERGRIDTVKTAVKQPRLLDTITLMIHTPVIRHIAIGGSIITAVGASMIAWTPAFLSRTHDMPLSNIGLYLGLIAGIPGALGMYLGGVLADHFGAKDRRWYLWVTALALVIMCPFSILSFLSDTRTASLLFMIVPFTVGIFFYQAASFAQVQNHVAPNMRAVAAASILFIFNLLGQGLGPQVVGIASDWLRPSEGDDALRYSLALMSLFSLWAAWHYFRAGSLLKPMASTPENT